MDDAVKAPALTRVEQPNAAWKAAQRAKQARYATQRRAHADALAKAAGDQADESTPQATTTPAPAKKQRRSRKVDGRQSRFQFFEE